MMTTTTSPTLRDLRIHDLASASRLVGVGAPPRLAVALRLAGGPVALPLASGGRLELTTPFVAAPGRRPRWRARARLHPAGPRLVPFTRVEVELTPWSPDTSELRLHPRSRAPHTWGLRRLRRYLRLLPHAADALAAHIALASAAAPPTTIDLRSTQALHAAPAPPPEREPVVAAVACDDGTAA